MKNDNKIVVYIVAGCIVLVILWQIFKFGNSALETVKDTEDIILEREKAKKIAEAAGTTTGNVTRFWELAKMLAIEMDTYIDDPFFGLREDDKMINGWNDAVGSKDDASIVIALYRNEMTNKRDLREDIRSVKWFGLGTSFVSKFNYL
jgi:hypothetical protein